MNAEEYCREHNPQSKGMSWKFLDNSETAVSDECPNDYITEGISPGFHDKVVNHCGSMLMGHNCRTCWTLEVDIQQSPDVTERVLEME
jgi:hypothetical protein